MTSPMQYVTMAAAAGLAAHNLLFIRGEWHLRAPQLFLLAAMSPPAFLLFEMKQHHQSLIASAQSTVAAVVGFYGALFASMAIYRLYFHPLRNYPGPFGAKITKLWHFYHGLHGQSHLLMQELYETYGDVVRVGPNELVMFTTQAAVDIDGPGNPCIKASWYDFLLPEKSVVSTRSVPVHDVRRKLWLRSLSDKNLTVYHERVLKYADRLEAAIHRHAKSGKPMEVSRWMSWFGFDCIGDILLSRSFDMLQNEQWHHVVVLLRGAMFVLGWLGPLPWLAQIGLRIFPWLWVIKDFIEMKNWCAAQIRERIKSGTELVDWSSNFIDYAKTHQSADSDLFLYGDSIAALVAGSDTTAAALTYSLYHLALDPDQEGKLHDELKDVDTCDRKGLQRCTRLDAFISEILRMHPPVPTGSLRQTPPQGIQIDGHFVPGGVTVSAPRYVIGTSEACFERPKEFITERWTTAPHLIKDKRGYVPFSLGRYLCVGQNLALMELRMVLSRIVRNYRVRFVDGDDGSKVVSETRDQFTALPGPLQLIFEHRIA